MEGWGTVAPAAKRAPSEILSPHWYFFMGESESVGKRRGDGQCACLLGCLTFSCVFGVSVPWLFGCWEDLGAAAA